MAEGHADARSAVRGPGDGVLPLVLAAPAHDEQVAARDREPARRSPAEGSQAEASRRPERHDRDEWSLVREADAVAVPGHRVVAVTVEVGPDPVEAHAVALPQRRGDVGRRAGRLLDAPATGQARFHDVLVVHAASTLVPRRLGDDLVEPPGRTGQPVGREVDPRALVEPEPPHGRPRRVRGGLAAAEQRGSEGRDAHQRRVNTCSNAPSTPRAPSMIVGAFLTMSAGKDATLTHRRPRARVPEGA